MNPIGCQKEAIPRLGEGTISYTIHRKWRVLGPPYGSQ
jgi:hypothetical protein